MNVAFPKLESGKKVQSLPTFPHPPLNTVGDKGQVKVSYNYFKIQLQIANKLPCLKCSIEILSTMQPVMCLRQIYCRYINISMQNG